MRNIADANRINVFKTNGFSKSLGEHRMTSKVLVFKEIATPPKSVQDELQLNADDTVYYLERLRFRTMMFYVSNILIIIKKS